MNLTLTQIAEREYRGLRQHHHRGHETQPTTAEIAARVRLCAPEAKPTDAEVAAVEFVATLLPEVRAVIAIADKRPAAALLELAQSCEAASVKAAPSRKPDLGRAAKALRAAAR